MAATQSGDMGVLARADAWDGTVSALPVLTPDSPAFTHGWSRDTWNNVVTKKENVRILDVACGNGSLSILAANEVKSTGGSVLATDFSTKMVEATKKGIANFGLTNIEAQVEDGQNLSLPDNSFDYLFSIFGYIFFPDLDKGFSEAFRVLKSGGKVGITSWTDQNPLQQLSTQMMIKHMNKQPNFPFMFLADEKRFEETLKKAGFTDVKIVPITHPFVIPNSSWLDMMKNNPGMQYVRDALNLSQEKFDEEFRTVLKEKFGDFPIKSTATALLGIGTKP
eukprot:Phypoly_transcript_14214.p1 GENE.Phypoly_transcript_14214~~Phypoly_transcript_14214.p1  ORF type:complete len:279 (+),score=61.58 Phypoly_transcript_14214:116-952(+)